MVFSCPAEENMLPGVKEILSEYQTRYIHNQPLQEGAAYLSHCNYFLGHDTGYAHIAGALKVPSFLVFGPHSSAKVWEPPFEKTKAYTSPNLKAINTNTVIKEIKEWFNC
jgi:ADP-heptose:LPS heptosyltransferase